MLIAKSLMAYRIRYSLTRTFLVTQLFSPGHKGESRVLVLVKQHLQLCILYLTIALGSLLTGGIAFRPNGTNA